MIQPGGLLQVGHALERNNLHVFKPCGSLWFVSSLCIENMSLRKPGSYFAAPCLLLQEPHWNSLAIWGHRTPYLKNLMDAWVTTRFLGVWPPQQGLVGQGILPDQSWIFQFPGKQLPLLPSRGFPPATSASAMGAPHSKEELC